MPTVARISAAHAKSIRQRDAKVFAAMLANPSREWASDCRSLGAAAGVYWSAAYCTLANSLGRAVEPRFRDSADPLLATHFTLRTTRLADVRAFVSSHLA